MATSDRTLHLVRRPAATEAITLTAEQSLIRQSRGKPLIVFGGPGTGKTTTLIESVVARIKSGENPDSILILAYGRERASDIRDRIVLRTGATTFEPLARTFHSVAFSIINESMQEEDFRYVLVSGAEQDSFIRQLLANPQSAGAIPWHPNLTAAISTRGFARELRDLISRASERDYSYQGLADRSRELNEPYWIAVAQFWKNYDEIMALRYGNVAGTALRIDPSAVITSAIHRLKSDSALRSRYQKKFSTIFVDEFQESDPTQRELLRLIAGQDLVVFADPDSAVGRFRGADPEGLSTFAATQGFTQLRLSQVLRSSDTVVALGKEVASFFRGQNLTRDRISTATSVEDHGIDIARLQSPSDSANYIAHAFRSAHLLDGVPWAQMAVILRSPGTQVSALQRAFAIHGIPVNIDSDALALADNPAITSFLTVAQLVLGSIEISIANWPIIEELLFSELAGADSISLRQMRIQLAKIRNDDDIRTVTAMMIDALTMPVTDLPWEQLQPLLRLRELIATSKKAFTHSPTIGDLLWAIWSNAKNIDGQAISDLWRNRALSGGVRGGAADRDLDAMMELFESARRFTERLPESSPGAFIDQLMGEKILGDTITAKAQREDLVSIMTVHSAKGLEWDLVALTGLQEGLWPNLRQRGSLLGGERLVEADRTGLSIREEINASSASALIEDERRLLHVAVTRARSGLIVTAYQEEDSEPSTYFEEIFDFVYGDCLDRERLTAVPRSLTVPALVSTLRRDLFSPDLATINFAGALLKTLAQSGIAAADPNNWLGTKLRSTTENVVALDQPISVSPSNLQSFAECGVKWFLERSGGRDGDSSAQLLGSAIHALAAQLAQEPTLTEAVLEERLRGSWALIDTSTGWVKDREFRDAVSKLKKFYGWQRASDRQLLGAEVEFKVSLGPAVLRGSVDRIELTSEGKIFIVDLKTGVSDVTKEEALEHKQLSGYQLAVLEGGFAAVHPAIDCAGAELVYLGGAGKSASIKTQPSVNHEELKAEVIVAAQAMSGAIFTAEINKRCRNCGVKSSCPIQSHGRSVLES
jgi:superfamily I DNA/RNA helicase/RecB family exonuclease